LPSCVPQHDTANIDVTIGDFATTKVDGSFRLVYLLRNTITNLITQETIHLFIATPTHLGFEAYDTANQTAVSHHYWVVEGQLKQFSMTHRYVWPAELDLMARMAGMILVHRWSGWDRKAFTSDSRSHISIWQKATT
jgi:hypothetical protein